MKLLPVILNPNVKNDAPAKPVFTARAKVKPNVVQGLAKDIFDNINSSNQTEKLGEKIKIILANPTLKNIFFASIASLVTAAAAQIASLSSAAETIVHKSDEDILINNSIERIIKHKGHPADFETNLINRIRQASDKYNLSEADIAEMIKLYNKFCGVNYKGCHYSLTNVLLSNKQIVEEYILGIDSCNDKEELLNYTDKFNNEYALQKFPTDTDSAKVLEAIALNKPDTYNILKMYKNIQNSYLKLVKDEQTLGVIDDFIKNITENLEDDGLKKMLFSRINKSYNECLFEIAKMYKETTPEYSDTFLRLIINKMISPDALKTWDNSGCKQRLDFNTYNNLILNDIDTDAIKKFGKLKRDTKFSDFKMFTPEHFNIKLPYTAFSRNFHLINSVFSILNKSDYSPLEAEDDSNYTVSSIQEELKKRNTSYPNLKEYLAVKDKTYLNTRKMQILLELYYGNESNKNIFTLHSYLRFLERVVLPEIKEEGDISDVTSSKIVCQTFIKKLNELKEALNTGFRSPINIETYQIDNVRAPQLIVNIVGANRSSFIITIDTSDKIHTIY